MLWLDKEMGKLLKTLQPVKCNILQIELIPCSVFKRKETHPVLLKLKQSKELFLGRLLANAGSDLDSLIDSSPCGVRFVRIAIQVHKETDRIVSCSDTNVSALEFSDHIRAELGVNVDSFGSVVYQNKKYRFYSWIVKNLDPNDTGHDPAYHEMVDSMAGEMGLTPIINPDGLATSAYRKLEFIGNETHNGIFEPDDGHSSSKDEVVEEADELDVGIPESLDLTKFIFSSSDHIRFENGVQVSGHNHGAYRAITIEQKEDDPDLYSVGILLQEGIHPVWHDNYAMAPKPMEITEIGADYLSMRGEGFDSFGTPFSDYGITIRWDERCVNQVDLHLFDRNAKIEYYKSDEFDEIYDEVDNDRNNFWGLNDDSTSSLNKNEVSKEGREEALDWFSAKFAEYTSKMGEVGDVNDCSPQEAMKFRKAVINRIGYCDFDVGQLMMIVDARRMIGKNYSEIVDDLIRNQ